MSKVEPFYKNDAFLPFGGDFGEPGFFSWFEEQGAIFLSIGQANDLNHDDLFDLIISHNSSWNTIDALPKLGDGVSHYLVPFSFEDQDEIILHGEKLSDLIEREVNETLGRKKIIASCDPRHLVAVQTTSFSYELISSLSQNGGANTHFVVFDEDKNFWVSLCSEFPFIVVSKRGDLGGDRLLGRDKAYWFGYFNENLPQATRLCSEEFVDFLKCTYIPRVMGYI